MKIGTFWEPKTAVKNRVDRLLHYFQSYSICMCIGVILVRRKPFFVCARKKKDYRAENPPYIHIFARRKPFFPWDIGISGII